MMKTRKWQWQWWRQEDDNDNDEDKKMYRNIYIYSIWHWQWCRSRWLDVSTNWAFSGFSDGEEISGIDWIRRPASICGSDSVHVWLDFLWGHILRRGEMAIALFMWHCTIFNERHIPCVAEIFYTFTLNISRKVEDNIFKIFFCWNISCRVELRFVGCFNKVRAFAVFV